MDTMWQTSIDRTLRSTEATLENLKERRRSYDRAKSKIDDYLGLATPHRDIKSFDSLDRTDVGVPPPLPQHRRYRATTATNSGADNGVKDTEYGVVSPSPSPYTKRLAQAPPVVSSPHVANGCRGDGSTAPLQLVNAQVRGVLLELELEKAKRADSIRELSYRTTAELAELRSIITQLQNENASLRKSVRALEGKLGDNGASMLMNAASHKSFSEFSPPQQPQSRSARLASAIANSGFALGSDASTTVGGGGASSLIARVAALESGLASQQQLAEERQTRTATVLREMVKVEVESDMAQVRTLAREAARDSTEDLLKLRLSALESNMQTEVQRALRVASASETTAQEAKQECGEVERRLSVQMQKLSTQFLEWQRGSVVVSSSPSANAIGSSGGVAASYSVPAIQERSIQFERVVEEDLQGLRGQLRQLRQDTETRLDRLSQEQKQTQTQLQSKANEQDLRGVVSRMEEQQYSSSNGVVLREQVQSLFRAQIQPLQDAVQKLQESTQEQSDNAEGWRRQATLRFAAIEASTRDFRDEVDRQDQQWSGGMQELLQLRTETAAVQARIADAIRQCKMDLTEAYEAKLQTAEERLLSAQNDRQQHWVAQLRQLQQSIAEQREVAQRTRFASDAAEERLRRVEAAAASMESTLSHNSVDIKARYDGLQTVLQQSCALPLSRVQQDMEGIQSRLHALDEDKTRSSAMWAQQLADAKQFFEAHVRNTRDMLEQRLSHQKELYEELRSQQSAQRRSTEEQQQLLLDQLRRLQQQQQQHPFVPTSTPVPAPVTATARSISEGQALLISPAEEESSVHMAAASTTETITIDAFHELEQQVQHLLPQVQSVEQRVKAVEKATADASATIADAIAPLQNRLKDMHDQAELEGKEQKLRWSEMEHTFLAQVRTVSEACERLSASTEAQFGRVREDIVSATSPTHFITSLTSDPASLRHLIAQLQDGLALPPDVSRTLEDVQAQAAQHSHVLDELRSMLSETQQQMLAVRADAEAEPTAAKSLEKSNREDSSLSPQQDVAEVQAEMQTALQELQKTCAVLQQRHTELETRTQQLAEEQLSTLAGEVEGITQATKPLPKLIEQLTTQCTTLQAAQRQQLPTLQKYVQDVLEVMQENQTALLDPLQLKLRNVEDHHKQLQVHLEEWMEEHTASVEQARQSQRKKLEQLQAAWETHVEAQFDALRQSVTSTQASLTDFIERVTFIEKQRDSEEEEKRQLRTEIRSMAQIIEKNSSGDNASRALDVAPSLAESLPYTRTATSAPAELVNSVVSAELTGPAMAQLQSYVKKLEDRLSQLEEQTSDSVAVTAETLAAFGQQLQDVVTRFSVAVRGAGADESGVDDAAPSPEAASLEGCGPIKSLEDIFTYFLHQQQQLQEALYRLQANTVETLEILEQHEETTAALPMLQHIVDSIAAALVPLAERLGVDATSFERQLTSPHRSHSHNGVDVYQLPYDSSCSRSSLENEKSSESAL